MLTADGFEAALIGVSASQPGRPHLAIYDARACVRLLQERDGMTEDEAEEFLEFNVLGAWVGDMTPVFVWVGDDPEDYDDEDDERTDTDC
jgi:hypothetical protein